MSSDAVLIEVDDGVAVITLNRPDNRNSMTVDLLAAFEGAMDTVQGDDSVRALVITGRGNCFCAGADFKANLQRGAETLLPHERSYRMYEPFLRVLDVEVPVIGALNGHAVGGGFGLALLCDIRIANREAKYGANFTRLGLHPGMAISYLLPQLVGIERAQELLYSSRLVLGEEAERIGLVSRACPGDEVPRVADELARTIAQNAPLAVKTTKHSLRHGAARSIRNAACTEAAHQAASLETDDAAEGMNALLEKREPVFRGR